MLIESGGTFFALSRASGQPMSLRQGIARRNYSLGKGSVWVRKLTMNTEVRAVNEEPLANLFANAVGCEVSTGALSTRESAWPN